jgi:hypothetical protein
MQDVVVTLSPAQARHLAGALRVELGMRWEAVPLGAAPCREEVERLRALLDEYGEQLERLNWGEPIGDVRVRWRASALSGMVRELREAAEEHYADSRQDDDDDARELLETARALDEALHGPELSETI